MTMRAGPRRASIPARDGGTDAGIFASYAAPIAVCFANLLAYFALGIVVPVLPVYMRGELRAGNVSVGVVMASYAVTTLCGRPLGGLWGDRAGYRRPASVGAVLILAGTLGYSLLPSVAWLLLCRLVLGLGEGLSQAACITWAVSLAPARTRAAILSYTGVSGWAGVALGALVGDGAAARFGYSGTFVFGALAPALGLGILAFIPAAPHTTRSASTLAHLASRFARQGAAYALVTVGYAGVLTFGVLFLRVHGAASPSLLLRVFVAGVIGVRLVVGGLPARLGPARTAALCAVAQASGTALVAAVPGSPFAVSVGGTVAGVGFGLTFPSIALDALERAPAGDRGAAIGIVSAFFDLGMAASGPVLGAIADRAGYAAAFGFAAGCAAIAAGIVAPRQPRTGASDASEVR
jgi:MFS family permease